MTIQKEPPGLWMGYCDHKGCATRIEIDCDPDDSFTEAVHALQSEHDWEVFKDQGYNWNHWCPDHEEDLEDIAKANY